MISKDNKMFTTMKTPINTIEQRIAEELSYRIEGTQGRFYFDMYVDGREVEIEGWCDYRDHIEKGTGAHITDGISINITECNAFDEDKDEYFTPAIHAIECYIRATAI